MRQPPAASWTLGLLTILAMCAAPLGAQGTSANGDETPESAHPSLRAGDIVLEFPVKIQLDWRHFGSPPAGVASNGFDLRRTRVAVAGTAFTRVHYEVEHELRGDNHGWRDVYVNVDLSRRLEIKGGRFKMPFSLEQLTSVAKLDFAYRSSAATYLAPGRDVGLIAHGTLTRGVKYQAGVFRRGGDNVRSAEHQDTRSGPVAAGRLTVKPWTRRSAGAALRGVTLGAAFTAGLVPYGLYSLRGHTIADNAFAPRVYVNGSRRRLGGELEWRVGRAFVQSEVIRVTDERREMGIDDQDLPAFASRGWYLTGGWRLRGRKAVTPGAVELAARFERFEMGNGRGELTIRIREATVPVEASETWTLGTNWQAHRFVRLQANAIHERREAYGVGLPGQSHIWSGVVRVQFSL